MARRAQGTGRAKPRTLFACLAVVLLAALGWMGGGGPGPYEPSTVSAVMDLAEKVPSWTGGPYVDTSGCPGALDVSLDKPRRASGQDYPPLDALGRCGPCTAVVSRDTMPTEKRGSIGMVRPSGWHTVRMDGLVDGGYLYNRCHLIGYQLTGQNANEENLVAGTRYLNVEGMLPWENRVADYVEGTGGEVLYRVTPLFVGEELVCRGVRMQAVSLHDEGAGLSFDVFCPNVQPGVSIDYATGEAQRI